MAKKNWMRPVGFCVGAPMANFVEYLFFYRNEMSVFPVNEGDRLKDFGI